MSPGLTPLFTKPRYCLPPAGMVFSNFCPIHGLRDFQEWYQSKPSVITYRRTLERNTFQVVCHLPGFHHELQHNHIHIYCSTFHAKISIQYPVK